MPCRLLDQFSSVGKNEGLGCRLRPRLDPTDELGEDDLVLLANLGWMKGVDRLFLPSCHYQSPGKLPVACGPFLGTVAQIECIPPGSFVAADPEALEPPGPWTKVSESSRCFSCMAVVLLW